MQDILKKIENFGIVPVIKIDNIEDAIPLAKALCEAGLYVLELTFRTDCAKEAIFQISKNVPQMLIGAGTVLSVETVKQAVESGAQFIVTPGFNENVVNYCIQNKIPIVPGCPTTSDIEKALELGISTVKFFPSEALGGLDVIKALAAPYSKIKFMPTGGINISNINKYLSFDKVIACGGSFMVPDDLVKSKEFDKITQLTKEAINSVLGYSLMHIGINAQNIDKATEISKSFSDIFGKDCKEGNMSFFVSNEIEVMKNPYLGQNGHIAFKTNSIERALHYLSYKKIFPKMDTAKYDKNNNLSVVYLDLEIGGFAVHLLK